MSLEKPKARDEKWPAAGLDKSRVFFDDISETVRTIENNSKRMFVASDIIGVEACAIAKFGCKSMNIRNVAELEDYLNLNEMPGAGASTAIPAAELFFIHQPHSRARLSLSENAANMIFTRIAILPSFASILSCFGVENGPSTEGRSGFHERTQRNELDALIFETGFMLKHVESKSGSSIPWSIRQMAVYQKYNTSTRTSSCLLVQTSVAVERRIFELAQNGEIAQLPDHWKNLHEIYLGTCSSGWSDYIKFLDEAISEIENAVRYARRDNPQRVTFATLQTLSKYSDLLIRISHALQLNISVLEKLSETVSRRQKLDTMNSSDPYEAFQDSIRTCTIEHHFLQHHVSLVRNCAQEVIDLVRNTITLTDSDVMLTLTQKTI